MLTEQLGGLLLGSRPARRVRHSMTTGSWRRGTLGAQLPAPPRQLPRPDPVASVATAAELRARRVALLRTLQAAAARGGRRTARRVPFYGR